VISADERAALEARTRGLCEAGDERSAGREIFGFLVSRLRDRDAAADVFSTFTEDLWRGLDGFRWQCTARVWAYTLARHATSHYLRDARRRRAREQPLSRAGPLSEIAQVMFHEGEVVDDAILERETVRLRKRYEATKKKLQRMALEAGLIPSRDEG
jgi:RNA polymerase sigma-70 factor (ECF subfamily)